MKNLILSFVFTVIALVSFGQTVEFTIYGNYDNNAVEYEVKSDTTFDIGSSEEFTVDSIRLDSINMQGDTIIYDIYFMANDTLSLGTPKTLNDTLNINRTVEANNDTASFWFSNYVNPGYITVNRKVIFTSDASVKEEVQKVRNTKVYPNPVVDQMTIEFETDETNMPVEVYSTNGQKVYSNNESRMFGTNTVKVNMSNKPRGMYIVRIGNTTKKVIKQ